MSSSVSKALEFCEFDLDLDEFEGASATARFCQIINDCFDIMNSKNQFYKDEGKQGITPKNLENIQEYLKN